MKSKLCIIISAILLVFILCGCSPFTNNHVETQVPDRSELISNFTTYNYKSVSFEAPDNWTEKEDDDGFCLYLEKDFLTINISDVGNVSDYTYPNNGKPDLLPSFYNQLLEDICDEFDTEYDIGKSEDLFINNMNFKHYKTMGSLSDKSVFVSIYLTYDNRNLYSFSFLSRGYDSNPIFEAIEQDIIKSISLKTDERATESSTEAASEAHTEAPTSAPTEAIKYGSADNPAPLGEIVEVYDDGTLFEISISNIIKGNEAYNLIKGYNQFNDEPPKGYQYILFDVSVKCVSTSESSGFDISAYKFKSANSSKAILKQAWPSVVLENKLDATLFTGSSVTGQAVALLPEGEDGYIVYDKMFFFAIK